MSFTNWFNPQRWLAGGDTAMPVQRPRAMAGGTEYFEGLNDPRLIGYLTSGSTTEAGVNVTVKQAMKNTTVHRCTSLISFAVGMLPLNLHDKETMEVATEQPLHKLLHRRPNVWQSAFEFRSLMQFRALLYGNAYAYKVTSGPRILQLVPLHPDQVEPRQRSDWSIEYRFAGNNRIGPQTFGPDEIFHLRYGLSDDGITGNSLVKEAAEAIALAIQSERAAARIFKQCMLAGGYLKHPKQLSQEAYDRLEASMEAKSSAGNAGKWLIAEEGLEPVPLPHSSKDSQHLETRQFQNLDVSRPFGVPRPLLNEDETNWGTGVGVLGQFFVRYGLNPWFAAWEQATARDLMTEEQAEQLEPKFDARRLLRGSMTEQAEFFSKALGSGGHQPWMNEKEVRKESDLPPDAELPPAPGQSVPAQQTAGD